MPIHVSFVYEFIIAILSLCASRWTLNIHLMSRGSEAQANTKCLIHIERREVNSQVHVL